jgi:RsiW-degrading membrane proteinase PrsW (M82 family)
MAKWFYVVDGQEAGPIEPVDLKRLATSGRLKPQDKLRRDGMSEWHRASEVKGLFSGGPSATSSSAHAATLTAAPPATDGFASSTTDGTGTGASATPKSDSASAQAGHDHSTHTTDRMRGGMSSVLTDLRSLNFWEEIVPIDATNIRRMVKDPVILAVIVAAIAPLLIVTLPENLYLTAFGMLFAFVWGMVFKHYIVRTEVSWKTLLSSTFFTGIVGMFLLGRCYVLLLPRAYLSMCHSENYVISLLGFLFQVGLWEESCKILPVVAYLLWKRRNADPKVCILIGVFSGLGFAVFENLDYVQVAVGNALVRTVEHGPNRVLQGFQEGVEGAMANALFRSLSCVFSHAIYTGIFSYFLTVAFLTGRRYIALSLTGLVVSAAIHGFYDWSWRFQQTLPSIIIAAAFILFYAYLLKLQALTENGPSLEPSASAN